MKFIVSAAILTLLSLPAFSQPQLKNKDNGLAIGLSGGISSQKNIIGNFSVGAQFENQNHVSINIQLLGTSKYVNNPVIAEGRFGHVFNTVEVYGGYGYQFVGPLLNEEKNTYEHNPKGGFKPAFGILKRFSNSLYTVSAGCSGNIYSIQVGILGIR